MNVSLKIQENIYKQNIFYVIQQVMHCTLIIYFCAIYLYLLKINIRTFYLRIFSMIIFKTCSFDLYK